MSGMRWDALSLFISFPSSLTLLCEPEVTRQCPAKLGIEASLPVVNHRRRCLAGAVIHSDLLVSNGMRTLPLIESCLQVRVLHAMDADEVAPALSASPALMKLSELRRVIRVIRGEQHER